MHRIFPHDDYKTSILRQFDILQSFKPCRLFFAGTVLYSHFRHGIRAIQMVAHVIANPQGEAIYTGILDCFTLRVG
jgi:hypothetical protein